MRPKSYLAEFDKCIKERYEDSIKYVTELDDAIRNNFGESKQKLIEQSKEYIQHNFFIDQIRQAHIDAAVRCKPDDEVRT